MNIVSIEGVHEPLVKDGFAISGCNKVEFPEGSELNFINMKLSPKYERREVSGSQVYVQTKDSDGNWHCECTGFKFRAKCKHLTIDQNIVKESE